mgnify:CR=1 FL=1
MAPEEIVGDKVVNEKEDLVIEKTRTNSVEPREVLLNQESEETPAASVYSFLEADD